MSTADPTLARWLQFNIVHHPGRHGEVTDELLCQLVGPHAERHIQQGTAFRFFFLRYFEHHVHLRYRLLCKMDTSADMIAGELTAELRNLANEGRIVRARYRPELTKYGGPAALAIAEEQFYSSSTLALSTLAATHNVPRLRLVAHACVLDLLLEMQHVSPIARWDTIRQYRDRFAAISRRVGQCVAHPSDDHRFEMSTRLAGGSAGTLGEIVDCDSWVQSTSVQIAELTKLAAQHRMTASPLGVSLAFAHLFANRIGLSSADEVLAATMAIDGFARPLTRPMAARSLAAAVGAGRSALLIVDGSGTPAVKALKRQLPDGVVTYIKAEVTDIKDPWQPWPQVFRALTGRDAPAGTGVPNWLTAECPVLPDPRGRAHAVAHAYTQFVRPIILQVDQIDLASPDSFEVLLYVARAWCEHPVVLIAGIADPVANQTGLHRIRSLSDLLPVLYLTAAQHPEAAPKIGNSAESIRCSHDWWEDGARLARSGAVRTALQCFNTQMTGGLTDNDQQLCLTLSYLRLGRFTDACAAARRALILSDGGRNHRLARRALILGLRSAPSVDAAAELAVLERHARKDLCDPHIDDEVRAWLLLDLAAIAAARTDIATHDKLLDEVIQTCRVAGIQSQIAVRLWRAASLGMTGHSRLALRDQIAAVRMLADVEDVSRFLQVLLRLAANLGALRRWRAAARFFGIAAVRAVTTAEYSVGATAVVNAIWSHVQAGYPERARTMVERFSWMMPLWSRLPDQLSLTLAEASIDLARQNLRSCKGRAAMVMQILRNQNSLEAGIGLAYRAVLLLRNCALRSEDLADAAKWDAQRQSLLAAATPYETPLLRALAE